MTSIKIIPIPALKDNYIWMLIDYSSHTAWVVDPGEPHGVINALQKLNLELKGILITHHHADHCGGIAGLLSANKELTVCGSHLSVNPYINHPVRENETIRCFASQCRALEIPGHTLDHVAYSIGNAVFSGDTLFSVGCGKIFEGSPEQMYASLSKLCQLKDDTQIYCGHEYTLSNLNFAIRVDPDNEYLQKKLQAVKTMTQNKTCTLPATLSEEKKINPFLRCTEPTIIAAVENHTGKKLKTPIEVFYHLREWKNKS